MTWTQAIAALTISLFTAAVIGIFIRCIQERLHFLLWPVTFLLFALTQLIGLFAPFYVAYKVWTTEESSFYKRIITAMAAVPIGYVYQIGRLPEISEITVWRAMREINTKIQEHQIIGISITVNKIELPVYSKIFFTSTSNGILDAVHSKLKIS